MKTDPTLEKIFKTVGDKHQVITTQVKEAYEIYMRLNMNRMREWQPVSIPNMGFFFVSRKKVLKKLQILFRTYRKYLRGEGGITREELVERLHVFLPVRKIANEHNPGTGVDYKIRVNKENGTYFRTKDKVWQSTKIAASSTKAENQKNHH